MTYKDADNIGLNILPGHIKKIQMTFRNDAWYRYRNDYVDPTSSQYVYKPIQTMRMPESYYHRHYQPSPPPSYEESFYFKTI